MALLTLCGLLFFFHQRSHFLALIFGALSLPRIFLWVIAFNTAVVYVFPWRVNSQICRPASWPCLIRSRFHFVFKLIVPFLLAVSILCWKTSVFPTTPWPKINKTRLLSTFPVLLTLASMPHLFFFPHIPSITTCPRSLPIFFASVLEASCLFFFSPPSLGSRFRFICRGMFPAHWCTTNPRDECAPNSFSNQPRKLIFWPSYHSRFFPK